MSRNRVKMKPLPLVITTALTLGTLSATTALGRVTGVDVYEGNGTVNWTSVAGAGETFGFAKATEGTFYQDPDYSSNMTGGKSAGLYMGAYHFAHPESNTPSSEANYFWNFATPQIKTDGKTLMPVLDFETFTGLVGASSYAQWADDWCGDVQNISSTHGINTVPIIYISTCSTPNLNSSDDWTGNWIANYNGESYSTGSPWDASCSTSQIWGSGVWDFWQYSSSGTVSGIPTTCDLDVFNGTAATLAAGYVITLPNFDVTLKPSPIQYSDGEELVFAGQQNGAAPWWSHNTGVGTSWTSGWLGDGTQKVNSDVAPVLNTNGYMEIFAIDQSTGYLRHKSNTGEGTSWGTWSTIGGGSDGFVGNPAVLGRSDGGVEVFLHNNVDNTMTHYYRSSFGAAWNEESLGGDFGSDPAVIINANNYVEVFATDASGNLVHNWNTGPGTAWNGWVTLGTGAHGHPSAIVRADGGVEVFVRHSNNTMDHYSHSSFSATWGYASLGGSNFASNPCAIENLNTHVEVFCIDTTGNLWHNYNSGAGTTWNGFVELSTGGVTLTSDPSVMINGNGATELFGRQASDYQAGHMENATGGWSSWALVGGGPD